jgi:putative ABC transport system ATP-binding protein
MSIIMSTVLSVAQLTKSFISGDRTVLALDDVTFDVEAGETCAIVGPSGSGKTTLLGLAAGLDRPTRGRVTVGGVELNGLDEDERAALRSRTIGFVFQNFQLLPALTAIENVGVPAELRGVRDANERARRWLDRVGLADRADHYPVQLSGGEQQRVALARAFINEPSVLFADEPTGNLDGQTSDRVVELLFELNRQAGTALVLVTHNMELARQTNRILHLRHGRLVKDERVPANGEVVK